MYYKTFYKSPIGNLTLASDGQKLTGLWIENQKYFPKNLYEMQNNNELKIFLDTKLWLDKYFNCEKPEISKLMLAPSGSIFRMQVWDILCEIPYGSVMTYGEIAKKIAFQNGIKSMSAQAVGNAVGHNPISIIIPCHRVIGTNGKLTGYAGGIEKKMKLLSLEQYKIR